MTEKVYSPYKLAIELGFTEEQAKRFEWNGTNEANMRRIAESLGLPSTKQTIVTPPTEAELEAQLEAKRMADADLKARADALAQVKKHHHYYRKDGTCACGAVRKVKA